MSNMTVMGHTVPYPVGRGRRRQILPVSYVSIGEWQVFGKLLKLDETHAMLELLYYSLHRAEPTTTRKQIKQLAKKHMAVLLPLVDLICNISLPENKKPPTGTVSTTPPSGSSSEAERAIKTSYRVLSRMHGWTPQQISEMSPVQVHIYLTGGEDGSGIVKMSNSQYKSFLAARRGGLN